MKGSLKNIKIIALGDSLTQGYPYDIKASWVNILNSEKGFNIINKGINGDTLEGMLKRFYGDVAAYRPDLVIIMGGTNDAFNGFSLSSMENNLKNIVKKALDTGIRPIIGIPLPVDEPAVEEKLCKFREFVREYCCDKNIAYIDFYTPLVGSNGRIKEEMDFDGIHPNKQGYRAMAIEAYKILSNYIYRLSFE
ncbi:hypothetical protein JT739_11745 [Tepidanaerobacter sp. GT38]|uniref:GDSL-type esterase/lipase family protein n=1 Tax=Tepidanaerobacter sp. GT38 TaxID=2722793 RepID=UPI001F4143AB|nr:GDSL-type esterase/lipase family protein [Tepidanaerobacter sp. GT38]MCG1013264.1 hypothetical protein [Tepidanaerobacter sp. GT38]